MHTKHCSVRFYHNRNVYKLEWVGADPHKRGGSQGAHLKVSKLLIISSVNIHFDQIKVESQGSLLFQSWVEFIPGSFLVIKFHLRIEPCSLTRATRSIAEAGAAEGICEGVMMAAPG